MNAEEMAKLFDIDLESNMNESTSSDYDTKASEKVSQTFEEGCEDIKSFMEPEINVDNKIIEAALEKAKSPTVPAKSQRKVEDIADKKETLNDNELNDISSSCAVDVSKDIAAFDAQDEDDGEEVEQSKEKKLELMSLPTRNTCSKDPSAKEKDSQNTPGLDSLGLDADDLKFCKECLEKYPEFTLYDGSISFKEFYKLKIKSLKSLLTRYHRLDIIKLEEELVKIDTDHFLGTTVISPDVIRKKIDDSYRARARLSDILIRVLGQYYMWERWCEMLRSKLWSDHQVRGAHNRDSMTATHMSDIEEYVAELEGLRIACEQRDGVLKAAADSLSRQLSCLQLKEATGFSHVVEERVELQEMIESQKPRSQVKKEVDLDGYDTIDAGEKIEAPKDRGSVATCNYGVPDDDLSTMG
jgi:hypothetical protein